MQSQQQSSHLGSTTYKKMDLASTLKKEKVFKKRQVMIKHQRIQEQKNKLLDEKQRAKDGTSGASMTAP